MSAVDTARTILTIADIMMRLVDTGATTVERLREIVKNEGATPEELAGLDQRLSDAIARRTGSAL